MRQDESERQKRLWQEALIDAVEAIAGLTAVDGATVISDHYELFAFGAKIRHREGAAQVEEVVVTEPVIGGAAAIVHPVQFGGTRHLSAAQSCRIRLMRSHRGAQTAAYGIPGCRVKRVQPTRGDACSNTGREPPRFGVSRTKSSNGLCFDLQC